MAACAEHHTPPASGPLFAIVEVIASIAGRSALRSRPKSTHPVIPHTLLVSPSAARPPVRGRVKSILGAD
jgi:hypothetical protein